MPTCRNLIKISTHHKGLFSMLQTPIQYNLCQFKSYQHNSSSFLGSHALKFLYQRLLRVSIPHIITSCLLECHLALRLLRFFVKGSQHFDGFDALPFDKFVIGELSRRRLLMKMMWTMMDAAFVRMTITKEHHFHFFSKQTIFFSRSVVVREKAWVAKLVTSQVTAGSVKCYTPLEQMLSTGTCQHNLGKLVAKLKAYAYKYIIINLSRICCVA